MHSGGYRGMSSLETLPELFTLKGTDCPLRSPKGTDCPLCPPKGTGCPLRSPKVMGCPLRCPKVTHIPSEPSALAVPAPHLPLPAALLRTRCALQPQLRGAGQAGPGRGDQDGPAPQAPRLQALGPLPWPRLAHRLPVRHARGRPVVGRPGGRQAAIPAGTAGTRQLRAGAGGARGFVRRRAGRAGLVLPRPGTEGGSAAGTAFPGAAGQWLLLGARGRRLPGLRAARQVSGGAERRAGPRGFRRGGRSERLGCCSVRGRRQRHGVS